jgi:RimJ/RimL family protein N-acetyltransferase
MIKLKPFNWGHVETHYEWNNDRELNYYDSDYPHTYESFESFVTRLKGTMNTTVDRNQIFEIICEETDELIGVVDILGIDRINNRCLIESTIGNREFRNKGFGKLAMLQALDYCFNELGMNKVSTVAFDFNEKWINLVSGMGFEEEGRLRKHVVKNGNYCDKIIFSMLKTEYNELPDSVKNSYSTAV